MIDKSILDEILPVPDREDLKDEIIASLENDGFVITSFKAGGVFYALLMLFVQAHIEVTNLLRTVLNQMYLRHATGTWLTLKAADVAVYQKEPVKTRGLLTLTRLPDTETINLPKGLVFKTILDIAGKELAYTSLEDVLFPKEQASIKIRIEAEASGARYNVPPNQISRSLIHLEGIDTIKNEQDWITLEGSDLEALESLRDRALDAGAQRAVLPTAAKYKSVCEAIEGVLFVRVDDGHPRGQGTVDIIVTSAAGNATEELLAKVTLAASKIKANYDNILVKSSATVSQNISLSVTVENGTSTDNLPDRITATVLSAMKVDKNKALNELTHADLIYAIKRDLPLVKNVKVLQPVADLSLDTDQVILAGEITVTILEV